MTLETIKTMTIAGNNGYADFKTISNEVKEALLLEGFTTLPSSSIYYQGVRVYAPKAIRAGRPS